MAQAVTAASVPLPLAFPLTSVADLLRDAASAQAELSLAAAVKLLQFDEMAQAEATTSATATLLATHFVHIFGSSGEPIRAISTDTLRRIIVGWLEKDNSSENSPRTPNHFFRLSALAVRVSTIMKWLLLLPQLADVPLALPDDELALSVPEASNVLEFVVRGLRLLAASLAAVPPTESVCPEAPRALGVVASLFSMGSASVSAWRVNLPQRRDLHYRDGTANTEVDTNARMLVRWCAKHVDGCAALAVVAENSQRLFSACLPLTEVGGAAPQPGASMDMDADFDTGK